MGRTARLQLGAQGSPHLALFDSHPQQQFMPLTKFGLFDRGVQSGSGLGCVRLSEQQLPGNFLLFPQGSAKNNRQGGSHPRRIPEPRASSQGPPFLPPPASRLILDYNRFGPGDFVTWLAGGSIANRARANDRHANTPRSATGGPHTMHSNDLGRCQRARHAPLVLRFACTVVWCAAVCVARAQDGESLAPGAPAAPGYLGLIGDDRLDPGQGVRVVEVAPGGPAQEAGVRPADLIVAAAGKRVESMADLAPLIERSRAGEVLEIEVRRDQEQLKIKIKLTDRPTRSGRLVEQFGRIPTDAPGELPPPAVLTAPRRRLFGLRVAPLTEEQQRFLRVPTEAQGVVVTEVESDSPAQAAGLVRDAVIVAIDGQPITNPSDVIDAINRAGPGKTIDVSYYLNGQLRSTPVTLRDVASADVQPSPIDNLIPPATAGPWPPGSAVDPFTRLQALERRVAEIEARLQVLLEQLPRPAPPTP